MALAFPVWTKRGVYQNKPYQFTARVHRNELLAVKIQIMIKEYFCLEIGWIPSNIVVWWSNIWEYCIQKQWGCISARKRTTRIFFNWHDSTFRLWSLFQRYYVVSKSCHLFQSNICEHFSYKSSFLCVLSSSYADIDSIEGWSSTSLVFK